MTDHFRILNGERTVGELARFVLFLDHGTDAGYFVGLFVARLRQAGDVAGADGRPDAGRRPVAAARRSWPVLRLPGTGNGIHAVDLAVERGGLTAITGRPHHLSRTSPELCDPGGMEAGNGGGGGPMLRGLESAGMAVWLALSGGLFYGFGDFSGGVATRRLPVWAVVSWSQAFGLSVLALGLARFPATAVTGADLAWGAIAGIGGAVGLGLLYRALADGTMAIISPITAATAAAIPVLVDLAGGGRFTNRGAAGILLALAAIIAIAAERSAGHLSGRLLATALVAGVGFAVFFIAISRTAEASGFWPLVAARGVTIPIAFALHRAVEPRRVMTAAALPTVAAAGLFDMGANLFIAAALQRGPLGIVVVLGSLYPAVTALAAVILLHERLSRIQLGGVALALGAVGLLVG